MALKRCLAVLLALLAGWGASAETGCWAGFFDYYYHAVENCALADTVAPVDQAEAEERGRWACPVCVEEAAEYGDPKAAVRGGTVVLRVPDAWIAKQPMTAAHVDDSVFFEGSDPLSEVARLAHGTAYQMVMTTYGTAGEAVTDVSVPWFEPENGTELTMNRRHLGAAWYIVLRPVADDRKTLDKKGTLDGTLYCAGARLALHGFGEPSLSLSGTCLWQDDACRLKPKKSKNKRFIEQSRNGLELAVYEDMETFICVIHELEAPGDVEDVTLLLDGVDHDIRLRGYLDGDDAIYCCVLTAAEAEALDHGAEPALEHRPGPEEIFIEERPDRSESE